jgi:Zn-finger nucleic acid-binding protein
MGILSAPKRRKLPVKCPVCKVPGFVVEYQGVELDLCPGCDGMWFDRGELELVLGQGDPVEHAAAASDEARRRCPICRKKMNKVNIGPGRRVLVDTCPEGCGVWFDGGELRDLTTHLEEAGWNLAPEIRDFLHGMFPDTDDTENRSPEGD